MQPGWSQGPSTGGESTATAWTNPPRWDGAARPGRMSDTPKARRLASETTTTPAPFLSEKENVCRHADRKAGTALSLSLSLSSRDAVCCCCVDGGNTVESRGRTPGERPPRPAGTVSSKPAVPPLPRYDRCRQPQLPSFQKAFLAIHLAREATPEQAWVRAGRWGERGTWGFQIAPSAHSTTLVRIIRATASPLLRWKGSPASSTAAKTASHAQVSPPAINTNAGVKLPLRGRGIGDATARYAQAHWCSGMMERKFGSHRPREKLSDTEHSDKRIAAGEGRHYTG